MNLKRTNETFDRAEARNKGRPLRSRRRRTEERETTRENVQQRRNDANERGEIFLPDDQRRVSHSFAFVRRNLTQEMRQKTERPVRVDDHVLRPVDQLAERQNDRLVVLRRHDRNATKLQRLQKSIRGQTPAARHQTELRLSDQIEIIGATRLVLVGELDDDVASVVQMPEKRSMMLDIGVTFAFEGEKNRPRATAGRSTGTRIIRMEKGKTDVRVRRISRTRETRRSDDRTRRKTKIQLAIVAGPRA